MPKAYSNRALPGLLSHLKDTLGSWNDYRKPWETIWAKAYRRVHNQYEKELSGSEGSGWRSRAFYGMTRQKCRLALALMFDTVFSQGKVPYDIKPTPVGDSEDALIAEWMEIDPDERTKAMKRLIDDQMTESKAHVQTRGTIKSGIEYGTGILRGPFAVSRTRNRWVPMVPPEVQPQIDQAMAAMVAAEQAGDAEQAAAIKAELSRIITEGRFYDIEQQTEIYPAVTNVDLWDVWLDPESDGQDEAGPRGVFERRVLSAESLAALAGEEGPDGKPLYDRKEIEEIVSGLSSDRRASMDAAKFDMDLNRGPHRERYSWDDVDRLYQVVTWSGVLPRHIVEERAGKIEGLAAHEEVDCLIEFCRDRIIRIDINDYPLRRKRYHVFRWARIEGSPYGWGLAQELEHPQSMANGFVRLYFDGKRLSSIGGTVMRDGRVKNATEALKPGIRYIVDADTRPGDAMMQFTFPDVGNGIMDAIKFCENWGDSASGLPAYLEGNYVGHKANTAYEAAELKAHALKQLAIPIQVLDEDVIVPLMEQFYHWNQRFGKDDAVKGDFIIHATGFASFKDKTLLGQELRQLLALYMQAPQMFPGVDPDAIIRKLEQLGEMPEGKFVRSVEETEKIKQEQAAEAQAAQQAAMQASQQEHQQDLEKIAAKGQADLQKVQVKAQADMQETQMKIQADAQQAQMESIPQVPQMPRMDALGVEIKQ